MYKKILIPIAPDHLDAMDESLEAARALAAEGAEIQALTVVEAIPLYVAAEVPVEVYQRTCDDLKKQLDSAFAHIPGLAVHAVTGHAPQTIVDKVREEGFDLVVIRSHKPGLQDWFLGSTAGRVVRHAPCSVHVIR